MNLSFFSAYPVDLSHFPLSLFLNLVLKSLFKMSLPGIHLLRMSLMTSQLWIHLSRTPAVKTNGVEKDKIHIIVSVYLCIVTFLSQVLPV